MEEISCTHCDVCSSVCPIVGILASRRIDDVFSRGDFDPWPCCSCHLCEDHCPEGLSPRDRMFALRLGKKPPKNKNALKIQGAIDLLKEKGFLVPVDEESNQDRVDLGLPEIDLARISETIKGFFQRVEACKKHPPFGKSGAGA